MCTGGVSGAPAPGEGVTGAVPGTGGAGGGPVRDGGGGVPAPEGGGEGVIFCRSLSLSNSRSR